MKHTKNTFVSKIFFSSLNNGLKVFFFPHALAKMYEFILENLVSYMLRYM